MNFSRLKFYLLLPILFFSCAKDHALLPDFSAADLALLHYTVGDTLIFADAAGHQFSVYADSVSDKLIDYDTISDDRDWKTLFARYHLLYFHADSLPFFPWSFSMFRYSEDYEMPTTNVRFNITAFPAPYDTLDFGIFSMIEENSVLNFGSREQSHEYSCGEKMDLYTVNGNTYYNVFRIMDFNSCTYDASFHVKVRVMYYSAENGIIAFELSDGSLWFSV